MLVTQRKLPAEDEKGKLPFKNTAKSRLRKVPPKLTITFRRIFLVFSVASDIGASYIGSRLYGSTVDSFDGAAYCRRAASVSHSWTCLLSKRCQNAEAD